MMNQRKTALLSFTLIIVLLIFVGGLLAFIFSVGAPDPTPLEEQAVIIETPAGDTVVIDEAVPAQGETPAAAPTVIYQNEE